jgi:hypothetical protein
MGLVDHVRPQSSGSHIDKISGVFVGHDPTTLATAKITASVARLERAANI